MKYAICWILLLLASGLYAQEYNTLLIPDSLKENANDVKRNEELDVTIESVNKVIVKHKYAITVLNEDGDSYATYSNDYSNLIDLKDISGNLYDASGKRIKSIHKKDIVDAIEEDGYSLITDNREKRFDFNYRQYPYTVEYEDEQEFTGTLFLPYWQPVDHINLSVMQSRFTVQTPPGYQLRYKPFNYPGQDNQAKISSSNSFSWEVTDVKAIQPEIWQPPLDEVTTSVFLSPTSFAWGGYDGSMNDWQDLGKFQNQLNAGRDVLPEDIKHTVHQLTDTARTVAEKVKILYNYLQGSTRYISIQLGIGGWQPLPASFVAQKKYGDCKALTNYMISLLKEAGIKADYVEVNAGENKMYDGLHEDFPAQFFNHVISCVPDGNDTIWLESTDQTIACGYLSAFTGNRKALLISEDGGHVVNTPTYTAEDNQQIRTIQAKVDSAGDLDARVDTRYTGLEQDDLQMMIDQQSNDKLLNNLKEAFELPTYDISNFHYQENKSRIPAIDEKIDLTASNYATISGKRLFIQPDLLTRIGTKLNATEPRKFEIDYPFSFIESDTVNIEIPEGYTIESRPKDVDINNRFGSYQLRYQVEGNKINFTRYYKREAGHFPPGDYTDLSGFYDQMFRADRKKMVFVKPEE